MSSEERLATRHSGPRDECSSRYAASQLHTASYSRLYSRDSQSTQIDTHTNGWGSEFDCKGNTVIVYMTQMIGLLATTL